MRAVYRMAESELYKPVRDRLEQLFAGAGVPVYLEVAAVTGASETIMQAIPFGREIVFSYVSRRPDILGYTIDSKRFIIVEVKEGSPGLDEIYQAKQYKEVFGARYRFLVTSGPIPEKIKRLCKVADPLLHSSDDFQSFLALAQFDPASSDFIQWFEENPFQKSLPAWR